MCYSLEELQQIIDGSYDGDEIKALSHIKNCPMCNKNFEELKKQDEYIEGILQKHMEIPQKGGVNSYNFDFKEKNNRRIFDMSKRAKKWSAVAAGLVVCGGLLFVGPVRAKANDLLKLFRVQRVASISISEKDFRDISKLFSEGKGVKNIGDIVNLDVKSDGKRVSLAQPKEADIKEKISSDIVKTPEGFVCDHVSKQPKTDVTMKLNVDKTNEVLNYLGEKSKLPKTLDGKSFVIHFDNVVQYNFSQKNSDEQNDYISVMKMKSPTVEIPKDVDEKELISTLFSMKFLPSNLKQQFMQIDDLTSTIPIPYDAENQVKEDININGQKAILIKNKNSEYKDMNIYFQQEDQLYIINSNCAKDKLISFAKEMK